jgi:hypothetical protein
VTAGVRPLHLHPQIELRLYAIIFFFNRIYSIFHDYFRLYAIFLLQKPKRLYAIIALSPKTGQKTPPLPFQTSTLLDRSRPSNSGVQTARARDRAGAVMCMRSTPGCGTLAGPSLVLVEFWSPKPKRSSDVPGLKRPCALGRPGSPGSVQPTRKSPAELI